jgi:hypothetical protein
MRSKAYFTGVVQNYFMPLTPGPQAFIIKNSKLRIQNY